VNGERWPTFPPLTDAERDEVHELLDKYADDHEAKQLAHVRRIERTGRRLGRRVARGELLLADAKRQLADVVYQLDHECSIPLAIVRADIAREVAVDAFDYGVRVAPMRSKR
jgi:hypothetical protein